MVFIINIFKEICDREVLASLLHGFFNFSDFDFWDQKNVGRSEKIKNAKRIKWKNNQSMKKKQRDKALIKFQKCRGGMFTCQLMHRWKLSKNKINGSFIETKQKMQSKKRKESSEAQVLSSGQPAKPKQKMEIYKLLIENNRKYMAYCFVLK